MKAGDLISSQIGSPVAAISNLAGGFASSLIGDVAIRQNRSIAGIIPDVTIEETHRDELTITEHPVEQGANVADHAFKQPAEIIARYGWTNSSATLASGVAGLLGNTGGSGPDVAEVYQTLLTLQESRQPFDVITGKRIYSNMLIRSLQVHTDASTENCLMVTAVMRQIILVDTQTTTLKPETQAQPEKTASPQSRGTVAPTQRSSLLLKGAQYLGLVP